MHWFKTLKEYENSGKYILKSFKESKRSKIRTANPEGLYLYKVEY